MGIKQWVGLASLLGTATLCGCQSDSPVKRNPQTTQQNASWDKTRPTQQSPNGPGGFSTSTGNPAMSGTGAFGSTSAATQPGFGAGAQPGVQSGVQPGSAAFPNGNGAIRPVTGTGSPTGTPIPNSSQYYYGGNPAYPSQPSSSGFAAPQSSLGGAGNPGSTMRTTASPTISEPPAPQFPGSAPPEPTSLGGGLQSVPPVPPQPGGYAPYNR